MRQRRTGDPGRARELALGQAPQLTQLADVLG